MITEKRKHTRSAITMPAQIVGRDIYQDIFREIGQITEASSSDYCLNLKTIVECGEVLHLSLSLPQHLRLYDLDEDIAADLMRDGELQSAATSASL